MLASKVEYTKQIYIALENTKGLKMGSFYFNMVVLVVVIASMPFRNLATNIQHTVGDKSGWSIPTVSNFYNDWASKQIFTVGDTLLFNFNSGFHDVAEVSKEGYEQCHINMTNSIIKDGPATINLTDCGDHYFICSFEGHCGFQMKLAINVSPQRTH